MNYNLFEQSNYEKFLEFDAENPVIYELFVSYAKQVKDAGHKRFSAEAIINRIRWHVSVETRGDSFKINNNHKPFYARKLVKEYPEFEGFFQFREQTKM